MCLEMALKILVVGHAHVDEQLGRLGGEVPVPAPAARRLRCRLGQHSGRVLIGAGLEVYVGLAEDARGEQPQSRHLWKREHDHRLPGADALTHRVLAGVDSRVLIVSQLDAQYTVRGLAILPAQRVERGAAHLDLEGH